MSAVSTNTCSCMSTCPSSAVSTGPRTVSTCGTVTPDSVPAGPRCPSVLVHPATRPRGHGQIPPCTTDYLHRPRSVIINGIDPRIDSLRAVDDLRRAALLREGPGESGVSGAQSRSSPVAGGGAAVPRHPADRGAHRRRPLAVDPGPGDGREVLGEPAHPAAV